MDKPMDKSTLGEIPKRYRRRETWDPDKFKEAEEAVERKVDAWKASPSSPLFSLVASPHTPRPSSAPPMESRGSFFSPVGSIGTMQSPSPRAVFVSPLTPSSRFVAPSTSLRSPSPRPSSPLTTAPYPSELFTPHKALAPKIPLRLQDRKRSRDTVMDTREDTWQDERNELKKELRDKEREMNRKIETIREQESVITELRQNGIRLEREKKEEIQRMKEQSLGMLRNADSEMDQLIKSLEERVGDLRRERDQLGVSNQEWEQKYNGLEKRYKKRGKKRAKRSNIDRLWGTVVPVGFRIQQTPGSYTRARKATRDKRLQLVSSLLKVLLGKHHDQQKRAFFFDLGKEIGIKLRLTPEDDSELCSLHGITPTARRLLKWKLKQFEIWNFFSIESEFFDLRGDLSQKSDIVIETKDISSPFPGVTVAYHSRILDLLKSRLLTLHTRGRLEMGDSHNGVIRLVVLVDKGDAWTKVVFLILDATGRQMSYQNCSLIGVYNGADSYENMDGLVQPVFKQLNEMQGRVISVHDKAGQLLFDARIDIHAAGDMMALLAMKGMGGPTMNYSCLMCYHRTCSWNDYLHPFVCNEKRTKETEEYFLQQTAGRGETEMQAKRGHKAPSLLDVPPEMIICMILHWKIGVMKSFLMPALLNLIDEYVHQEKWEEEAKKRRELEEAMEEVMRKEEQIEKSINDSQLLSTKASIIIGMGNMRTRRRPDATERSCESDWCLYTDERSSDLPDIDHTFVFVLT